MEKDISNTIIKYPLISGIILILTGMLLLYYNIKKMYNDDIEEYGILDWQAFIGVWVLGLLSLGFGVNFLITYFS